MPNTKMPSINSEVAIGRRMNGAEMFTNGGFRTGARQALREPVSRQRLARVRARRF